MTQQIRIALLSCWLGVMAFFSFVVAPTAFRVLPTQHLAGQVVSRSLGVAEIVGLVTAAMAMSRVVSGWMHDLRVQAGDGLYALPASDPIRSSFDQMHKYSVGLTGFALLGALVLILMLVTRKGNHA